MLRKNLHFEGLAKPALLIFVAAMLGGACNYLYQSYMMKSLEPADYSELTSLLSIFYILTIPSTLIGRIVLRYVSKMKGEGNERGIAWLVKRSFIWCMIIGTVMLFAVLISMSWLTSFLELSNQNVLLMLAVGSFLLMIGPPAVGSSQGLQRFRSLSLYNIFGPAGKLIMGIILVTLGLGVDGAFGGMIVGTSLAFGICYFAIWDYVVHEKDEVPTKGMLTYFVPVALATLSFGLITNIDTFLVRGLLDPFQAGLYSSASMLGKIVLWIPGAITTVTFPRFSEEQTRNNDSRSLMRKSLIVTVVVLMAVSAVFVIWPDEILVFVATTEYQDATICLPVVIIAFALFGLASVFMNYGLAIGNYVFIAILFLFTVLGTLAVLLNHETPLDIGYDMLFTSAGICAISVVYMEINWARRRKKK